MKPTPTDRAEKRINLKISDDIHHRLKIQAVNRRMTLQDLVALWLREKLEEVEGGE